MDKNSKRGIWNDIVPFALPKKDQKHSWVFAAYTEAPSQREDNCWYTVFLFRNKDRTVFGLKEYRDLPHIDFSKLATRAIQDKEFRESLISTDPTCLKFGNDTKNKIYCQINPSPSLFKNATF